MIMENKINIAELLKDCPKGMKLYSPLVGDCKFVKVHDYESKIIVELETGATVVFQTDGRYYDYPNAECLLYPAKGKNTWEGFVPPCKFEDGDVIYLQFDDYNIIAIFKQTHKEFCYYYVGVKNGNKLQIPDLNAKTGIFCTSYAKEITFATEYEKEILFNTIKNNGYKWDEETKTLEKLIGPNFHEGDWIACEELNTAKILSINMDRYEVEFIDGNKGFPHIDYIDRNFHLWTIQDAKDGDILAFNDETIVIFKDLYNKTSFHSYCHIEEGIFTISKKDMPDWWEGKGFYPATEEQRTFLFRKIKEAGYKWNAETKTLEKLIQPKFKVGDRVQNKNTNMIGTINLIINDEREYRVSLKNGGITYILFEFQDDWELVKDNSKPKFKVGDRITKRDSIVNSWIVSSVSPEYYGLQLPKGSEGIGVLPVVEQDDWVLVPNKFDITTLKPYESRVLVRGDIYNFWKPAIFGFIKDKIFYLLGGAAYEQCIPYKNNEHLLGTKNDCDDFYKTWE